MHMNISLIFIYCTKYDQQIFIEHNIRYLIGNIKNVISPSIW